MKEIDPNAIAVELVKQFATPIFDGISKIKGDTYDKLKVILNKCFSEYIVRSYDRYSKTKTLLYRDAPVSLRDFYVRTDLEVNFDAKLQESDFVDYLKNNKRIVISGTAGSGKSTFCKSILLELIENPIGIFPIFVELRHLNSDVDMNLMDYVLKVLADIEPAFTKSQLDYCLKLGKVLLIFDGFDELNNELRGRYEKEIIEVSSRYQNILVMLSSRPDSRFHAWEEFYVCRVLSLDKEKSKCLINKLDYDRQVKRKFLEELDQKLYKKHTSFASNPLLLTMMLLTFEQIAEIPNKIHLFYEQAFLTLFNKHDSLKSLYKRKSFSNLPLDDFKKMLAAFSVVSYLDRVYYFSDSEIEKYLVKASKVSGMEIELNEFLKDLLDTVCIMQRDGTGYTFTHRSFQEYFTSIFLVTYSSDNKYKLINKIAFVNDSDDVIPMVFDINQDLLEQEWIIPRIDEVLKDVSLIRDTDYGAIELLSLFYHGLTTYQNDNDSKLSIAFRLYSREGDHARFFHVLYKIYNDEINSHRDGLFNKDVCAKQVEAENNLIEIILKGNKDEPDFIELSSILEDDLEIISLICNSNCVEHLASNLSYANYKISFLKDKYVSKKKELSELLFG